ncbi:glycoside hydrolase [Pedobacter sp. MW01-1-1]|uniref:glycoside hydrolase n=1 Tax=Pedobacter sp. MW01-1-1 TaxID=3383027 RepID=UPI003FED564A
MIKNNFQLYSSAMAFAASLATSSLCAQEKPTPKALVSTFEQYMITTPPDSLHYPKFYEKYTDAFGIPVVSSAKVSNTALLVARDVINYMLLKRPDIRRTMIGMKARLSIMAWTEMQTDLPEYSDWKKPTITDKRLTPAERENYNKPGGIASMTDKGYWNQRARGMGGIQTSCAEENILGIPGTKYYGENILVHEWSHNVMSALRHADPALYNQIQVAYDAAKEKGLYKDQYAINTVAEYWAEGSQWWFWSNFEFMDGSTRLQSPDDLKAYDPALYNILAQVYPGHHIPGDVYYGKNIPYGKR